MKELNVGIFGTAGHQILKHVGSLERSRVTAVGGVDEESFEKMKSNNAAALSETRYCSDWPTFLAEGGVDLVSLCWAPRAEQATLAIQALEAGKCVLAEKPLATTQADLDAVRAAAEASEGRIWAMVVDVYPAEVRRARAALMADGVGQVVQVFAMKSSPYHAGRPQDRLVDGGIFLQFAIHAIGVIHKVTGLMFEEVCAFDTGAGNPLEGDLQMAGTIQCRMSNGALATVLCNYCNARGIGVFQNNHLRVHGTEGMLEFVDGGSRHRWIRGSDPSEEFPDAAGGVDNVEYPQDIVDAILDGRPGWLTQEDSLYYTQVALRAQESASQGGVVLKI